MLLFKGIQKTTLIDYPGKVATTLFLPKCNFKCPFCYNPLLVLDKDSGVEIPEEEALAFLNERKDFLDGVCITGGEPLMHSGLPAFCKKVKEAGILVKIDSNGSFPEKLQQLIEEKLVDYIAIDIKGPREKYNKSAGVEVDLEKLQQSIDLVRKSGIEYEFRMTVVPKLHSKEDLLSIGKWLNGSTQFFLQQFNSDVPLLDKNLEGSRTYSKEELQTLAAALKPFFGKVAVRGI